MFIPIFTALLAFACGLCILGPVVVALRFAWNYFDKVEKGLTMPDEKPHGGKPK